MKARRFFLAIPLLFSAAVSAVEDPCFAISPSWYRSECECGTFVSVDFLYWYGRESNLTFANRVVTQDFGSSTRLFAGPSNLIAFNTSWDPGVRVGIGANLPEDGWDLSLNWTYMKNKSKGSASATDFDVGTAPDIGNSALLVPWFTVFEGLVSLHDANLYSAVSSEWEWWINRFDLEIGRRYFPGCFFSLRPFGGITGYWDKTKFQVNPQTRSGIGEGTVPSTQQNITYGGSVQMDDSNWGVGLLGGLEPTWNLTSCFALFARFDLSLLWGRMRESHAEARSVEREGSAGPEGTFAYNNTTISFEYGMQPILDLGLGLRYETYPCQGQFHFTVDAGWEHHTFFSHNLHFQGYEGTTAGPTSQGNSYAPFRNDLYRNDLSFGGFTLRARLDF